MIIPRSWPVWLPAAFLFLACSRQPTASSASRFAPAPPVVDGRATEWTDSLHYDPTSKLQYQVLNDGRAVYLRIKAADPATQAKIVRLGLTVWLDTTGRNQHQFGVRFPIGGPLAGRGEPEGGDQQSELGSPAERRAARHERMTRVIGNMREMELLNYKGSKEPTLTDAQSQLGVKAALGVDAQEDLIYELAVPMRLLYRKLPALAGGRPAVVGITIAGNKWNPPVGSPGGSVMNSGQGGMGMRGGMPGGGMRGGGMRGSYGIESISLKTSVQLSSGK
ncbi:hypothetical protein [Hymenobacter siberiensis]|uniref:hypothetical protein n=1 Tax=Hymenobacter siberiensis TaxID=2848396 RepID=UPI001C1E0FD2|nr:hypothetical protein [Hymenobacter siberiensis]MBU6121267.1 hypothetical protein [Hymenobacter siberiensis]